LQTSDPDPAASSAPPTAPGGPPTVPGGPPAMFNPAQFHGNQSFKQPVAPVPGHRLSSRRVYPK